MEPAQESEDQVEIYCKGEEGECHMFKMPLSEIVKISIDPSPEKQQTIINTAVANAIDILKELHSKNIYWDRYDSNQYLEKNLHQRGLDTIVCMQSPALHPKVGDLFNLNQQQLQKLIQAFEKGLNFKINNFKKKAYAFVLPEDKSHTIYLTDEFFKLSEDLKNDCQIGTLIHEVSHFRDVLGLTDFTFKQYLTTTLFGQKEPIFTAEQVDDILKWGGIIEKSKGSPYVDLLDFTVNNDYSMKYHTLCYRYNANNLEYEIERYSHYNQCGCEQGKLICQNKYHYNELRSICI